MKKSEEIANILFCNGMGQVASRLVLELPDGEDGGGWCKKAVVEVIDNALQPVNAGDAKPPCDYCSDAEKMGHRYCPKCGLFWGTPD